MYICFYIYMRWTFMYSFRFLDDVSTRSHLASFFKSFNGPFRFDLSLLCKKEEEEEEENLSRHHLIFIGIVNLWLMPIEDILTSRKGLIIYYFSFSLFPAATRRYIERMTAAGSISLCIPGNLLAIKKENLPIAGKADGSSAPIASNDFPSFPI